MSNNKRLERDLQNKVLGGVCSGLGNYFEMDPTFWRVLFFFLFLIGCSGLLIYIILWIAMPAAAYHATADHFASQPGENQVQEAGTNAADPDSAQRKKNSNMAAGLTLIGVGVVCLLARYIPQISWRTAWPIILIVLGIILILPIKIKKS
jgi:phage shock protein PspC (stress-responsive transcriptional regulator)